MTRNLTNLAFASVLIFGSIAPRSADARRCPNIMFVVDRSGSMAADPMGGASHPNKWELMRMGVSAAVQKYGTRLSFGLEMFTTNGGGPQCYNDTKIDVYPAHNTAAQIVNILLANFPAWETNTGEAIKRAYTDGRLNDKTRGNYIVLITDGDPNCNLGDGKGAGYTISELKNAAMKDPPIYTYVVGFDGSGGVDPANLNGMAVAGGEPISGCDPTGKDRTKPCYYSASNVQKFLTAMDMIIGGLAGGTVVGGCDDTCFSEGCPEGQECKITQLGQPPMCVPDPCVGNACDGNTQFCRDGQCLTPCPYCGAGNRCVDQGGMGVCVTDKCLGLQCNSGLFCDDMSGACLPDFCLGQSAGFCPLPTYCASIDGTCTDDPCRLINCPPNSTCYTTGGKGYCMEDPPMTPPDMTLPNSEMSVSGGGDDGGPNGGGMKRNSSCAMGGRGPAGDLLAPLSLLALGALLLRRRKSHA
jgi:MYXO-CTERM domain-containing protein